jgi:serine/threonine protein kinase
MFARSMAHLDAHDFAKYLAAQGDEIWRNELEVHIDECNTCRQGLSELVRKRGGIGFAPTHITETESPLGIEPGQIIDERYRIERAIGMGGMGAVFEAHHLNLNQKVALKFILPEFAKDPTVVDRFTREGRAASRLLNEHTCRVFDLGKTKEGIPFLVLECLQGESVEKRFHREGPFSPDIAFPIVQQALLALHEAHQLGIVHRDIKPANLFFARRNNGSEVVKVLDFGIAKSIHPDIEAGLQSTSARVLLGSPMYMAPEQISNGGIVDSRTDIWAIGVTLYQFLTGRLPFVDDDLVKLMYGIQTAVAPPLKKNLAPEVDALVLKCLSKSKDDRFATVMELHNALGELLVGPAGTAKPFDDGAEKSPFALSARHVTTVNVHKSNRWVVAAAIVALGITTAGVIAYFSKQPSTETNLQPVKPNETVAKPVPVPEVAAVVVQPKPVVMPIEIDAGQEPVEVPTVDHINKIPVVEKPKPKQIPVVKKVVPKKGTEATTTVDPLEDRR